MENYEKKYKQALGWMQSLYNGLHGKTKEEAEHFFPELRESEDEKIRKELIEFIDINTISTDERHDRWIAWLEKQGEQKPKMTPKWLYRLEYRDASCGLWYDGNGKWCFESGIGSIDGCKTKSLPMDYDERYKQDGRDWFSSCSQKEDLLHWYSLDDAKKLIIKGFVFTRYLATEYHEYNQQTVFIKDTALYREEVNIFDLFEQKPTWSEEDEKMFDSIIDCLDGLCFIDSDQLKWLKSLKDRVQPKQQQSDNCDTCDNDNDYTKSNRKKCEEISELDWSGEAPEDSIYQAAYIMAEWKDKQFQAEKQQLIEKACKWLDEQALSSIFINSFKKEMQEGEQ